MVPQRILYAGDNLLSTAASYLAGILARAALPFEHVAGNLPIRPALQTGTPSLIILSDYPAANFNEDDFENLLDMVRRGTGLLMIGGWESFHGLSGDYDKSPLAQALPVRMLEEDDRVNSSQPWLIEPVKSHPIIDQLPFRDNPTYVGGFNRIVAREDAELILQLRRLLVIPANNGEYQVRGSEVTPLLVTGSYGAGRVAAFATDVAPHWVGGLVDWGPRRMANCAKGAKNTEVGSDYVAFFTNLVRWMMDQ